MGANASQITCLRIVYLIVYSGADQRKHQSSASLAFVRGIHRWPVSSPHKWPVTRKMFPFDDVIMGVPGQQSQKWPPGSLLCYMTSPLHGFIWHLVFIFFGKIYCLRCMWIGPPHLSLVLCYIFLPTDTYSMQNLILEGLQQKWLKSCSRCNKNTRHVESGYILQPPKYLLLFVNRFRYINNNGTKDRCPIPMDTTVRLGPLKFSLQAT